MHPSRLNFIVRLSSCLGGGWRGTPETKTQIRIQRDPHHGFRAGPGKHQEKRKNNRGKRVSKICRLLRTLSLREPWLSPRYRPQEFGDKEPEWGCCFENFKKDKKTYEKQEKKRSVEKDDEENSKKNKTGVSVMAKNTLLNTSEAIPNYL